MSDEFTINPEVLRAWCDTPSHFLPPEQPAAQAHQPRPGDSVPPRHQYTPAEISQQSVDLLLREYYAMVTAQRTSGTHKSEGSGSGFLQRTFLLLLCPAPPACCELDQLLKASISALQLTAKVVVVTACLWVPVWLGLIRHVWQQQGPQAAAALAAGGTLLLLLCDLIYRSTAKQQAAKQAACVTPANLQQQLQNGSPSHELATLRAASRTATTSNSSRPGSMTQQQTHAARHTQQQQQQQAAAVPSGRVASGGGGARVSGVASYAALEQDLAALQAALGVSSSSRQPPGSREHVVEVLSGLCGELGMAAAPDSTASSAELSETIARLKERVGI